MPLVWFCVFTASAEEGQSDGDDFSVQDESGAETTEGEATVESSGRSSPGLGSATYHDRHLTVTSADTPVAGRTKAAHAAATRGLNIAISTSDRGNRHSRMMGLPTSPRPVHSPVHAPPLSPPPMPPSPMHTPK